MTWNYRVVEREDKSQIYYNIEEVYYDDDGKISSWVDGRAEPFGENILELKADIGYMLEALEQPVLRFKNGMLTAVVPDESE